ncbi:MAG: shikimate dehydrogenase, partial [Nocardioidaceae bacterium]|nr:shikimate dehydrogenase [Nocardioidaceae bacterium]
VADLVASTIPAQAQTPALVARLAAVPVVFEVVYDPWPTPLAASAGKRTLVSGLDLLVHQAALQVGQMTGATQEAVHEVVPAMRAAVASRLS